MGEAEFQCGLWKSHVILSVSEESSAWTREILRLLPQDDMLYPFHPRARFVQPFRREIFDAPVPFWEFVARGELAGQ